MGRNQIKPRTMDGMMSVIIVYIPTEYIYSECIYIQEGKIN